MVQNHDTGRSAATEEPPTLRWRKSSPGIAAVDVPAKIHMEPLEATARAFQNFCLDNATLEPQTLDYWCLSFPGRREHAELFRQLHRDDPNAADRLARAFISMPIVGSEFLGFRLLAEIGRGGFGRVFLAQQGDLANRRVVVKIAADLWGEAGTLAQLQHANIVPVYSVHHLEPFQAVCMPFLGCTTLLDVLHELQLMPQLPTSGAVLLRMMKAAESSGTRPASTSPGPSSRLDRLTYVEAITWLGAQLADGLAHAHERGIVHHDLKPANVLLTDQGCPMLLDFNVAEDTKRQTGFAAAFVAGTLPYMAPEQLAAIQGDAAAVDARSDLFAFGIILFELLTGRYPFKYRDASLGCICDHIIEDRRAGPPRVRTWNPAVSPALEAIVRHCLEPDPARRYQSARALQEDLERQCAHRPLRHIAEPSRKERLGKWIRRHPRILSASVVALLASMLLSALGAQSQIRERRLDEWQQQEQARIARQSARDAAVRAWRQFQDDLKTAQFILYTRTNEPEQLAGGVRIGLQQVERYGVLGDRAWLESPLVTALLSNERHALGEAMAELLLLLARARILQHDDRAEASLERLDQALLMNERAAESSTRVAGSPALCRQRSALLSLLGREAEATECRVKAQTLPLLTAADHYWLASDYIAAGRLREALPLLQKAEHLEPQNFWAWFVLANCWDRLGADAKAEACYGACIALKPSFHWAYFNRGLALLRQLDYRNACADFDIVIEQQPDLADAYLNRALAHQGLQQFQEAEQDLTEALERGGATRLYFLRARIRQARGDKAGAQADYDEGLRRPPVDEMSWLARGFSLLTRDPQAALADFEQALRLNPRSADALQNKAHVLAEKLGRNQEALEVLNHLLSLYPDSVKARGGRGVILARLGKRAPALQDAEETLLRDNSPPRLYQVACIYALTSKHQPEDRVEAFRLLSLALRKGHGFNLLESDDDLGPIRGWPEFRRLADAARGIRLSTPAAKKS